MIRCQQLLDRSFNGEDSMKLKKCTKVKDVEHLKTLASKDGGEEFIMMLKHRLISRKHISWDGDNFWVLNYIDNSDEILTEKQIQDDKLTNIGKAIRKGAFYVDE